MEAATETVKLLNEEDTHLLAMAEPSLSIEHLEDMIDRMASEDMEIGKMNRWLGWIQAAAVATSSVVDLETCKKINKG